MTRHKLFAFSLVMLGLWCVQFVMAITLHRHGLAQIGAVGMAVCTYIAVYNGRRLKP